MANRRETLSVKTHTHVCSWDFKTVDIQEPASDSAAVDLDVGGK